MKPMSTDYTYLQSSGGTGDEGGPKPVVFKGRLYSPSLNSLQFHRKVWDQSRQNTNGVRYTGKYFLVLKKLPQDEISREDYLRLLMKERTTETWTPTIYKARGHSDRGPLT